MELADKELGAEGDLHLELKEGKVVLTINHASKALEAQLSASVDPDYFIDKLKVLIPGSVDDAIFDVIEGALKGL